MQGVYVGVVIVYLIQECYVFIYGFEWLDVQWQYDFYYCCGVVVFQGVVENLDVMDIIFFYMFGVLCGGSYVYVYSFNGQFVSFIYNDYVLYECDLVLDLCNVGVVVFYGLVMLQGQYLCEYGGSYWCVLVSCMMLVFVLGSDEINCVYEEGWVGNYILVFIGDMLVENGDKVFELFIVDLLQDEVGWKQSGGVLLVGIVIIMLVLLVGVSQCCLIFIYYCCYLGLVNVLCYWVCVNFQVMVIVFLMCDDVGVVQLWFIFLQGGELWQLMYYVLGIQLVFNWYLLGEWLGFVLEDWIVCCYVGMGDIIFLIDMYVFLVDVIVFLLDGKQIVWMEEVDGYCQLWVMQIG